MMRYPVCGPNTGLAMTDLEPIGVPPPPTHKSQDPNQGHACRIEHDDKLSMLSGYSMVFFHNYIPLFELFIIIT